MAGEIKEYVAKIGESSVPLPPEIAADDNKVRAALTPYFPEASSAQVKRSVKDGVQTIELVKMAGPKG